MKSIYNIEAQIEAKEKLLKENYKKIQEKSKQNELLIDVLEDYHTYMEKHIEKDKLHQAKFQILNTYISSLLENKSLSKNDIQNLKREKKEIKKILDKNK